MSEMVERVARALYETQLPGPEGVSVGAGFNWPWDDLNESGRVKERWREIARAAIAAMREPTGDMIDEGADALLVGLEGNPSKCWRAMIDAALKD